MREKPHRNGEQLGLGMYPHFEVSDAAAMVEKACKAGYRQNGISNQTIIMSNRAIIAGEHCGDL